MKAKLTVILFLSLLFLAGCLPTPLEPVETGPTPTENFITEITPVVKDVQREFGILPSIIMGQAILESNSGQSELAATYHNLFGIKAYGDEEQVVLATKEFVNDEWITIEGTFRVYPDWAASIRDHAELLVNGVTWNSDLYKPVIMAQTYQEAAAALQAAGYATDPHYSTKIIAVIEQYELAQYD